MVTVFRFSYLPFLMGLSYSLRNGDRLRVPLFRIFDRDSQKGVTGASRPRPMKIHTLLPVLSIAMTVLTIAVTALVRRRSASTLAALLVLGAILVPTVADLFALRLRELHQIALYMREGFAGEFGGAFALLLFSVLYGRKEPREELKKSAPLLLLVGIGALFSSDLLLTEPGFVRLLLVPPARLLLIGNSGLSAASFFLSGIFLLAFFQMAKTYSAASTLERWNLKYPMIGVSLWAFSVLVVHGTLVVGNGFDRVFLYLEEVGLLLTDGFFLYAFLVQRPQDVALALTRQTINRSVLFLLGGVGLVVLAGLANALGALGPVWGRLSFGLSLVLGVGAFVVVFSSDRLRREFEEFLGVHFYSNRYDYRQAWMTLTRALAESGRPEELLPVLMEQTREITLAQSLTYGTLSEGASVLVLQEAMGWSPPRSGRRIELGPGLLSRLSDGLPRNLSPSVRDQEPDLAGLFRAMGATWLLPLVFQKRLIGILGLNTKFQPLSLIEDRLFYQALSVQWTSLLVGASLARQTAEKRELELLSGLRAFTFHDLKNAGGALKLLSHNAKRNMEDPEFREELLFCLENISGQIESSLEGLLSPYSQDYSRLSDFSPADRIREVVRALGLESTPALKVVVEAKESPPVRGNPKAFDTTLRNLLINAREILEGQSLPGEIRVGVRDEGEHLSVVVSDNGPGMSREFMETRLFRPFQTTKKKGTGLGLFSCKLLLEQSGGRIGAASREGEGSEFWITYPRAFGNLPERTLPEM